jgi:hypothetical protein
MSRTLLAVLCSAAAVLVGTQSAAADVFSPIEMLSVRASVPGGTTCAEVGQIAQAETASEPAISKDGRYVAFVGTFDGVSGIWRRDLQTCTVEQVAPAGATLPSISEDGAYVSFTTAQALDPEDDHNHAPDVYVRDMERPCRSEGGGCLACGEHAAEEDCPFVVVSAVDGGSEAATYVYPGTEADEEPRFGSLASGRSAMSANGRDVVFETAVESNLLGAPTPAREILLRDLETDETTLVSSEYDPQTNQDTGVPVPVETSGAEKIGAAYPVTPLGNAKFGGASISADGSTVAWLGQDIARQAKLLPGEQTDYSLEYNEPLWRRVADGPSAPTRRVTGGSEPENPSCEASGESEVSSFPSSLDPCHGPFALFDHLAEDYVLDAAEGVDYVPQLSADGNAVAFLASAREVGSGEEIAGADERDDLYVTHMEDGLPRIQAQQRLTEISGEVGNAEFSALIVDLAISPDGGQVAFTTQRTLFSLGTLSDVSPVSPRAGIKELFDADLSDQTLTRVTHGFLGESVPSEQANEARVIAADEGAASPSFSEDNELSFASSADNLVYGDGNESSDVFLVHREVFANTTPQQLISGAPAAPALQSPWKLFATARRQADGEVALEVEVPGAGQLSARASAPVLLRTGKTKRSHTELVSRTVASARAAVLASAEGVRRLTLKLVKPYEALARRATGLETAVDLKFAASGQPTLSVGLQVEFHAVAHAHAAPSRRKKGKR